MNEQKFTIIPKIFILVRVRRFCFEMTVQTTQPSIHSNKIIGLKITYPILEVYLVSKWNYELNIDLYEWKTCWNWYVSDPDQMKHEYCATYPHFQSKQFINVWLLNRTNVKKQRVNCRKTKKGSDRYLLSWKVQFKGQLFFWCLVQKFQEKRLILISLYNGSN